MHPYLHASGQGGVAVGEAAGVGVAFTGVGVTFPRMGVGVTFTGEGEASGVISIIVVKGVGVGVWFPGEMQPERITSKDAAIARTIPWWRMHRDLHPLIYRLSVIFPSGASVFMLLNLKCVGTALNPLFPSLSITSSGFAALHFILLQSACKS